MKMISVMATALAMPAIAQAEDCAGVNVRYSEDTVTLQEVEDGPTTYFVRSTGGSTQTIPLDSGTSRWQQCVGFFVTRPDGPPQGTGNCYTIDSEGNIDVTAWDTGGGETTWETVRGTGKFEARVGSTGTAAETARFGDGLRIIEWSGTCTD